MTRMPHALSVRRKKPVIARMAIGNEAIWTGATVPTGMEPKTHAVKKPFRQIINRSTKKGRLIAWKWSRNDGTE